ELPRDPEASQGILAVPNTKVDTSVQLEFGLGDSGLNNSHGALIPPYGSISSYYRLYNKNNIQSPTTCSNIT
ncbi:hypothetical protein S245_004903, partial [Arachis hypogaea]